jgi:glycosyltransferase involved in cell wall biosynthesis
MQNLKSYLDKYGFPYSKSHKKAKSIFFPVSFDKNILKFIKSKNGIVIQRLDGIYYPSKHGDAYIELNKDIKDIYLNYSDAIVFQSEYSKKQCFAMLGEKKGDEYTVILNGVNKTIFSPDKDRTKLDKPVQFVTTGNFRNVDMIEPLVKALDSIQDKFDFQLNYNTLR